MVCCTSVSCMMLSDWDAGSSASPPPKPSSTFSAFPSKSVVPRALYIPLLDSSIWFCSSAGEIRLFPSRPLKQTSPLCFTLGAPPFPEQRLLMCCGTKSASSTVLRGEQKLRVGGIGCGVKSGCECNTCSAFCKPLDRALRALQEGDHCGG